MASYEETRIAANLIAKADRVGKCFISPRVPIPRGYVNVFADGAWWRAHRLVYHCYIDDVLPYELILHTCDNRKCLNPKHLYKGTAGQNTRDMMRRKRNKYVITNKIRTDDLVAEAQRLRDKGLTFSEIGYYMEISKETARQWLMQK